MDKRNLNDEFEKALHIHNQGDLTQAGNIYKKICKAHERRNHKNVNNTYETLINKQIKTYTQI